MADFDDLVRLLMAHREVAILAGLDFGPGDRAIVAGAYEGTTIKFLADFFCMEIHGYEPQDVVRQRTVERLRAYQNVYLHDYGIGVEEGRFPMVQSGTDRCSFIVDGTVADYTGRLRRADDVLNSVGYVNLMLLNMEQYEHVLLPYMAKHGLMRQVDHLMVQFHGDETTHVPSDELLDGLAATHELKWKRPRWQWAYWAAK